MKAVVSAALLIALSVMMYGNAQELVPGVGFSSAPEISPGVYSYYLGPGELHFFKLTLEPGEVMIVLLRMASNQDFDVYVLNPMRELVVQGIRPSGLTETVEYTAAERGPHYIVVAPFGDTLGTYTLTVYVQRPKTVTATVTVTSLERVTETHTTYIFQTQTVVSERAVTQVEERVVEVERIPWTAAGLAVLAAALIYVGYAASNSLRALAWKREEPSTKAAPPQTGGEKPAESREGVESSAEPVERPPESGG